jgi:quercetin dioxygenase-like cupin family protein
MHYVRLALDSGGETHFEDAQLDMSERDYRPPAPLMFVSHARTSSMVQFVRLPAGWEGKSITVPEPQFVICVAGKVEITTSNGGTRAFAPGNVILMEDNSGRGHSTRVVGDDDWTAAIAPVTDQA